GTEMHAPNDVSMEEIPLEDDERDSIEYKILMAYAQWRLSVSKYRNLLKKESNVQKSSLIREKAETDNQRDKEGPTLTVVSQGGVLEQQSKNLLKTKHLPGYRLRFFCSRARKQKVPTPPLQQGRAESPGAEFKVVLQGNSQHQTSETADVNHIADKLAKLVTSRSPSDVTFRTVNQEQEINKATDETEGKEHNKDEEKIIQTIVSLLGQTGDQLEEKIKKDRVFYQHFKDMLSYSFFKRITDLFLEDVSAVSTSKTGDQVQCTKVAFTMEVATRLTAVDNHPMNLVLGFGLKYLREHFKAWIQDQGGWVCALPPL
ncbi:B2L14 protein, partial [Nycticryphes semicollaris]|nr:B2L14 protein [Nycticryphes semicollaris]